MGPDDPADTNSAPTASATTVEAGATVQLDGTDSSDPDGDDLTFTWSLDVPSGSSASLSDASDPAPSFTADVVGDYTATLSVSDGQAGASDDVAITATLCPPTVIDSDIVADLTLTNDCSDPSRTDYVVSGLLDVNGAQ